MRNFLNGDDVDVEPVFKLPIPVSSAAVEVFVESCYNGGISREIVVNDDLMKEVFVLSDFMDYAELRRFCESQFSAKLDYSTCCDLLLLAEQFNCMEMKNYALKFLKENMEAVLKVDGALKKLSSNETLLKAVMFHISGKPAPPDLPPKKRHRAVTPDAV